MNPLTADEMACVASECRGKKFEVIEWNGTGIQFDAFVMFNWRSADQECWKPAFDGHYVTALQRDQALAVVEWLIEAIWERSIDQSKEETFGMLVKFGVAVIAKDTTALQRMVLELRNPQ